MLLPDEVKRIKKQLIEKMVSALPKGDREDAVKHIESLDSKELEEFLRKNNLAVSSEKTGEEKCIFCSIVFGDIESYKIAETSEALAVLEINPVSNGHTLIVPKKHITSEEEITKKISKFAEDIGKKIREKLKPKEIKMVASNLFGHEIINLIPVHGDESLDSKRKKAKKEELEELQKKLVEIKTKKRKNISAKPKIKKLSGKKMWLPERIP